MKENKSKHGGKEMDWTPETKTAKCPKCTTTFTVPHYLDNVMLCDDCDGTTAQRAAGITECDGYLYDKDGNCLG